MKKLPEAEQELMMIIWDAKDPITRSEIEEKMCSGKSVMPSTVLTLLSRLEERGFVVKEKRGKINYYTAAAEKEPYLQETGKKVLKNLFGNSLSVFAAALYSGERLNDVEIDKLQNFLDEQRGTSHLEKTKDGQMS
ncbi:BlaI/MecI/CopY family transcriptional regulator [Parablautia muri]|uniref:BlaI/MecI/CopY family transcriptional regulator n=1 Tax=Parablautia muri TaxID=2320879 RepID=A0A9X5BG12_9FIRM|nr:BlaI/MecI/CopY family transcriptional regulator [Parablautia muri]NBJ92942.1 BlaI/MecI/CopY family transcriptional regulator [Parablautia muri]